MLKSGSSSASVNSIITKIIKLSIFEQQYWLKSGWSTLQTGKFTEWTAENIKELIIVFFIWKFNLVYAFTY